MSSVCTYWQLRQTDSPEHLVTGSTALMDSDPTSASDNPTRLALNDFLAGVERRAFVIARVALRDDEDALDVVQDTMIRLAKRYAQRPQDEWQPLFYRILKNRIVDLQRRRMVRQKVMAWLPLGEDHADPVENAPGRPAEQPDRRLELDSSMEQLQEAVEALPARQREAFLLRALEGMDVAGTAQAMGCSAGSVKTHYFRAVRSLRAALGEHWKPATPGSNQESET